MIFRCQTDVIYREKTDTRKAPCLSSDTVSQPFTRGAKPNKYRIFFIYCLTSEYAKFEIFDRVLVKSF